jgi:hypothetical protein
MTIVPSHTVVSKYQCFVFPVLMFNLASPYALSRQSVMFHIVPLAYELCELTCNDATVSSSQTKGKLLIGLLTDVYCEVSNANGIAQADASFNSYSADDRFGHIQSKVRSILRDLDIFAPHTEYVPSALPCDSPFTALEESAVVPADQRNFLRVAGLLLAALKKLLYGECILT